MRRAKIVATLGPATDSPEQLAALLGAGVDVVRLNFSHGTHAEHARRIAQVRAEAERQKRPVAILQDLQGPKIRTGALVGDRPVTLIEGRRLIITTEPIEGTAARVPTDYEDLPHDVRPGDRILLSDGLMALRVVAVDGREITTEIVNGGVLRAHQGINLPGVAVSAPAVTPKDLDDLQFGLSQGVDYVAISFVRRPEDVSRVQAVIASAGEDTPVIAKLEKPEAVKALDGILAVADGVMVARGDMGVELPPEAVPMLQKQIIRAANRAAVPVITATQMLDSMIHNPRPTRAEVSDVANAILDGSDAIMLSGETAIGEYAVDTVRMMDRIARAMGAGPSTGAVPTEDMWAMAEGRPVPEAVGAAVSAIVRALPVPAICVLTKTGSTARVMARFRPAVPILAFTPFSDTYRSLSLIWGVTPIKTHFATVEDEYYRQVEYILKKRGYARDGDTVVLTGGHPIVQGGPTNFIKILTLSPEATAGLDTSGLE